MSTIGLSQITLLVHLLLGSAPSEQPRTGSPVPDPVKRQLCGFEMGDSVMFRDVPASPLNRFDRLLQMSMHFPYLSRRDSFLEAVRQGGPSQRASPFACAMIPHFLIHLPLVYTSLSHFWCTSMRILCAYIIPITLHQYADSRTRFPNELLSLEQNKDAPCLTKEIIVWVFSEFSRSYRPCMVTADPSLFPSSPFF